MRLPTALLTALTMLTACMADPPRPPPVDDCGAAVRSALVGRPLASFDPATVSGPVRILAPDSVMTMDHNPQRLNVHHDASRVITRLTCG